MYRGDYLIGREGEEFATATVGLKRKADAPKADCRSALAEVYSSPHGGSWSIGRGRVRVMKHCRLRGELKNELTVLQLIAFSLPAVAEAGSKNSQ